MGNFYVNICVKISDPHQLISSFSPTFGAAFVGPSVDGWTCFSSEAIDSQDQAKINMLGIHLSAEFKTTAVAVLNHDDSILSVDLYREGEAIAEFNSCPGYFNPNPSEEDLEPRLSDASAFASLVEDISPEDLSVELLKPELAADTLGLHEKLVSVLRLPQYSIAAGYRYINEGMYHDNSIAWTRVN